MKRLTYGVSCAGAAVAFCVFLIVLRVWQGPCGFDVYYYALQTRALSKGGALLFSDRSLVYRVLYFLDILIKNPILSAQILSAFSIAAVYFCLLILSFRGGVSGGKSSVLYKTAAATIAVFNPAVFYQLLEFIKNNFAFALFFPAWLLLTNEDNRLSVGFKSRRSLTRSVLGLLLLAASVFSHRIMLILFLMFAVHNAAVYLRFRHGTRPLVLCLLGMLLVTTAIFFTLRNMIAERLSAFALSAPLHRLVQLSSNQLSIGERIFYTTMQIAAFFLLPFMVIRKRLFFKGEFVFAAIGWLFLFPFLHFTWDGIGFRLLILAPLMIAPVLMGIELPPPIAKTAAGVFIAAALLFSIEASQNLARNKGPDYRALRKDFTSIEALTSGRRVIAHRGLAGFLWYEKGIRSENFLPVSEHEKYLRLVYAFSPEIFESYLQDGEPAPITINRTYTLIEEYLWQRFYQDRRELYFLKSELNPYLSRPVSGFVINERIAALLSPVSETPAPAVP
ncbi:hypothetical protein FACS1894147_11240 [Spirochaetia bacterium]|nr:hypothetical protein FACS1894147_11240 [Spirochaetia bacterium]